MGKLRLPKKFKGIVEDKDFYGSLTSFLNDISDLLDKPSVLFPEYTDHSSLHVQDVLDAAENIVSDESYEMLTGEDVYVLVVGICLHDIGMVIDWDQLNILLTDLKYNGSLENFEDEKSWSILWSDFENDFKKLTIDEIKKIIGSDIDDDRMAYFPVLGENNSDIAQLKVAGEFIRRHHARIAQAIATYGYPGLGPGKVFTESMSAYNQLAGLVARSHHESLRSMHDRLAPSQRLEYRNCHLIFIMAILRISDLMQITSKRTPLLVYEAKAFWSEFSRNEWKRHLSILNIKSETVDPACLFFELESVGSIAEVHSIRGLLNYFQLELDQLWAVLGEAYSGNSRLKKLSIQYRRVDSDLNCSLYVKKLRFLDDPAMFKVDLSLVKKLIQPLYGNIPAVGVRELLQNALDTVRERSHLDSLFKPVVKIFLESCGKDSVLKIVDQGCGMDEMIIRNYFLNIGSSFRGSKEWSSKFSNDFNAEVNRSGRFGIGMLAGFILGEEVSVLTRRYTSLGDSQPISFKFSLESELIQLNKADPNTQVGTQITIKLNAKSNEELRADPNKWKWYFNLDNTYDEVEFYIDSERVQSNSCGDLGENYWVEISSLNNAYKNFRRGSHPSNVISSNMMFVNSLKISSVANGGTVYNSTLDNHDMKSKVWGFDVAYPPISLEDPELNLPLNLARNSFSEERLDFAGILYNDLILEYLKNIALCEYDFLSIESASGFLSSSFHYLTRNAQVGQGCKSQVGLWGLHKNGLLFSDFSLLKLAGVEHVFIISPHLNSKEILECCPENSVVFKLVSEPQFYDSYNRDGLAHSRECQIFSIHNSGYFWNAIFGNTNDLSGNTRVKSAFFYDNKNWKVDLPARADRLGMQTRVRNELVEVSFEEQLSSCEFKLNSRDFVLHTDISSFRASGFNNLFSKRWSEELSSPFINKTTKFNL